MQNKTISITGSLLAALAVLLGAFGAHGLGPILAQNGRADTFDTAVFYHFIHALAILLLAVLPVRYKKIPFALFTTGILCFSGSLYLLSLTNLTWLGMIAPLGGTAFAGGWLMVSWSIYRS